MNKETRLALLNVLSALKNGKDITDVKLTANAEAIVIMSLTSLLLDEVRELKTHS